MVKKIKLLSILIATFLVFSNVYAEGLKIVVIDLQEVIAKSELGKSARAKLEVEMDKAKSKLAKEAQAIKSTEIKIKKQASLLSKSAIEKKMEKLNEKKRDLQRRSQDEEEELKVKNAKYIKEVIESARESLRGLVDDNGYDFVLEKARGLLLYADDSIDVTDKLIERLNQDRLSL